MNLFYKRWTDKSKKCVLGSLYLEECNDNFREIRGMRNLSNNNVVVNKETGETLIEIYVT